VVDLSAPACRPGGFVLHRLDPRLKLVLVACASAASLHGGVAGLVWVGGVLVAAGALCARLRPGAGGGGLRWLGLLLALVLAARAVATEGAPVFSALGVTVTAEGLRDGAVVCLRLALAWLVGALLTATTRSSEVRAAVRWYLKPVPLVPADRVATMLGLLVRFVPLILEESARTAEAQRARAVENRRNPVYRASRLAMALMRRVLTVADRLALAMEARCYTEARTAPALAACRRDWLTFAAAGLLLAPGLL
jgi:energy-coupling factor transporter transmembrane protein EcfT